MKILCACMLSLATAVAGPAPTPAPAAQEVTIEEKLGQAVPLNQPLKDEAGHPVTVAQLVDKPTLLTLNYFSCAGICTPQLQGVVDVLNRVGAVPGKDFQVVTVSFDPRDTVEIAAQKRTNYLGVVTRPMPPSAWRFLVGAEADTKALADAVGFKFRRQGQDYVHPAAIIVLSPKGVVTRYLYGITYLPADLEMAVREATRGQARPTINRILDICFSYDPEGRRYVFSFTRIAAVVIILGAAAFVLVLVLRGRGGRKPRKENA